MWLRSTGPASGGTGTIGTPAARPTHTATTVSSDAVAQVATADAPVILAATEITRCCRSDHEHSSPATAIASLRSAT